MFERWPVGMHELFAPPKIKGVAVSPFLVTTPKDPWTGKPYIVMFAKDGAPEFSSLGSDQAPGGSGRAADLSVIAKE